MARRGRWIIGVLGTASAVFTFLLAGQTVALWFVIALLAVLLVLTMHLLGERIDASSTAESQAPPVHEVGGTVHEATQLVVEAEADNIASVEEAAQEELAPDLKAMYASLNGDIGQVKEHVEEYVSGTADPIERNSRRALGDLLLVRAGDEHALSRLAKSVKDRMEPRASIVGFYASALNFTGNTAEAVELLEDQSQGLSAADRAAALIQAAQILAKDHRPEQARRLAAPLAMDASTDSEQRAEAWVVLAETYRESDQIAASIAYEKALSLNPASSTSRFNLAYHYSQMGQTVLSRFHYLALQAINQGGSAALNNLGVANEALGMAARAFHAWETAGEGGSAVAFGNIANQYLDIGAVAAASAAIESGALIDADDARIVEARRRLKAIEEEDSERATELAKIAGEAHDAFAGAALELPQDDLTGRWLSNRDDELAFTRSPSGVFHGSNSEGDVAVELVPVLGGYRAAVKLSKYTPTLEGAALGTRDAILVLMSKYGTSQSTPFLRLARSPSEPESL